MAGVNANKYGPASSQEKDLVPVGQHASYFSIMFESVEIHFSFFQRFFFFHALSKTPAQPAEDDK